MSEKASGHMAFDEDSMVSKVAAAIWLFGPHEAEEAARAALEAMREPTQAMIDCGSEDVWRAMIDQALKEPSR